MFSFYFTFSQSFPTHQDNPEWSFKNCYSEELVTITTLPDTLIDGKSWIPLQRSDNSWSSPKYYRVDGQKVYYRTEESNSGKKEFLMYDFSLEEGELVYIGIPGSNFLSDSLLFSVAGTGEFFFGNTPRKYIIGAAVAEVYQGNFEEIILVWIEGIGDTWYHPFYPGYCLFQQGDVIGPCYGCEVFVCLSTNAGVLYADPDDDTCQYPESNLTRIYVDQNNVDAPQNGSSWQYAFDDLQEAIAIAEPGDSIWVAEGTYFPTPYNNRAFSFYLNPGVKIFGGFEGTETALSQRDWESHETILSGDIGVPGDSTDNSYHVVYTIGTDSTAILDGFTITRGFAVHQDNGYVGSLNRGGGILVDTDEFLPTASPVIRNCDFHSNVGFLGGALACNGQYGRFANPALENCFFYENTGTFEGGAVYKLGPGDENTGMHFSNCSFENNWAWQGGAAVFFREACNSFTFLDCGFSGNNATDRGGAVTHLGCEVISLIFENCHFDSNRGGESGAFAFMQENIAGTFNFSFAHCVFTENESIGGSGGAMFIGVEEESCTININYCEFLGNFAEEASGGIYIFSGSGGVLNLNVQNSLFKNNIGHGYPLGGAIYIFGELFAPNFIQTFTNFENTVFVNNKGGFGIGTGRGLAVNSIKNCSFFSNGTYPIVKNWSTQFDYVNNYNNLSISNSIIWEPQAPLTQVFYNGTAINQNLYDYTIRNCLVSHPVCDLPGGEEACVEGMIIGQNPMFLDEEQGDLHIGACSPAVNGGSNEYGTEILNDLDGNPRILEEVMDMGAYERESFYMAVSNIDSVSCNGGEDGVVNFETNGDWPLTYFWESGIFIDTTASGLSAGEYLYTITDAAGCQDTFTLTIPEPDTIHLSYEIQDASAFDAWDGALTLEEISGGTPPYQWFWNTEDTSASLENIPPGWYVLNILDANHCLDSWNFDVGWVNAGETLNTEGQPSLFPNPVKQGDYFQLDIPGSGNISKMEIMDVSGKILSRQEVSPGQAIKISTKPLTPGSYLVLIWDGVDHSYPIRLVVY